DGVAAASRASLGKQTRRLSGLVAAQIHSCGCKLLDAPVRQLWVPCHPPGEGCLSHSARYRDLSVRKTRQPLPVRRDRKTRRVHEHGEIGVVPVDAGDIQDTDFAKTL